MHIHTLAHAPMRTARNAYNDIQIFSWLIFLSPQFPFVPSLLNGLKEVIHLGCFVAYDSLIEEEK